MVTGDINQRVIDPMTVSSHHKGYEEAILRNDREGWISSYLAKSKSPIGHDIHEWMHPADDAKSILSKVIHRWKHGKDRIPVLQTLKKVMQGVHEIDADMVEAALLAHLESVHLLVKAALEIMLLIQL